jgi:sugar/nucleoside kinase (ribokinase family)
VLQDGLGLRFCNYRRQCGYIRLLYRLQTAEMFEKAAGGGLTYSGNLSEFGGSVSYLAALAMEGYGEAMSFVPYLLH